MEKTKADKVLGPLDHEDREEGAEEDDVSPAPFRVVVPEHTGNVLAVSGGREEDVQRGRSGAGHGSSGGGFGGAEGSYR